MTVLERLILYVVQCLRDLEAFPSRTRILKIIYLIDVEYYRRHRRTLTGEKWIFYHYGPYLMHYPQVLERLALDLEETEDTTTRGHSVYSYQARGDQDIEDIVPHHSDHVIIDTIIKRWGLEDIKDLLNHVYFYTEPMSTPQFKAPLDFSLIPPVEYQPIRHTESLAPPKERQEYYRHKLAEAFARQRAEAAEAECFLSVHPFEADEHCTEAMRRLDSEERCELPLGAEVRAVSDDVATR